MHYNYSRCLKGISSSWHIPSALHCTPWLTSCSICCSICHAVHASTSTSIIFIRNPHANDSTTTVQLHIPCTQCLPALRKFFSQVVLVLVVRMLPCVSGGVIYRSRRCIRSSRVMSAVYCGVFVPRLGKSLLV